jgi:hypothetical protein
MMVVCTNCKPWAATTERQWRVRKDNIRNRPDVRLRACERCGGTEWATTRHYLAPEPRGFFARIREFFR